MLVNDDKTKPTVAIVDPETSLPDDVITNKEKVSKSHVPSTSDDVDKVLTRAAPSPSKVETAVPLATNTRARGFITTGQTLPEDKVGPVSESMTPLLPSRNSKTR